MYEKMKTWYEVEYSYKRPGSEKIKYKGLKAFNTKEEAEKFAAVVYWLSNKAKAEYDLRQLEVSEEYLGKGKFVELKKIYRYTKNEIKLKIND
jgi:Mor family transcriptional regulator